MIYTYKQACLKILPQRSLSNPDEVAISEACAAILQQVKSEGDEALYQLTKRFDNVDLKTFEVPRHALETAFANASEDLKSALTLMIERLKAFHNPQLQEGYALSFPTRSLGQVVRPLDKVMVYVPGGTAIYVSTLLMNVIPAAIAGVKELYVCSPPQQDGTLSPSLLCACSMAGIQNVYTLGGAQAIGAFAYGTNSIPKVDKIVGPGNAYVAASKKLVFGEVGIDMIAGPSEVLIIADHSANPQWVAADALAQLEHDPLSKAVILSPQKHFLEQVAQCLSEQKDTLSRIAILETALSKNTFLVQTDSISEAIDFANHYAPEHLGLAVKDAMSYLPLIQNAGAVFLGEYTPEAVGDYTAGSNHVLPTLGTARFQSPLGVYDFQKRMSYAFYTSDALKEDLTAIQTLTKEEGLDAHRIAAEIRLR